MSSLSPVPDQQLQQRHHVPNLAPGAGAPKKYPLPFVKWAGGKARLLAQYEPFFPASFDRYIEPFVGGGAVFFSLARSGWLRGESAYLLDSLEELINCYRVIQGQVESLIEVLQAHDARKGEADYFYAVRGWDRQAEYAGRSEVERAARFLFLNHTCYNGLYRVNRKGQFNVPVGRYANPRICNVENLRAVRRALQGVTLAVGDFEACVDFVRSGDFVYLDPPYHPLSDTANFTSYTSNDFGVEDQRRLADLFRELDRRGCLVMLSNSNTSLVRQLYRGFEQIEVQANRVISSKRGKRGGILELLVVNDYERRGTHV